MTPLPPEILRIIAKHVSNWSDYMPLSMVSTCFYQIYTPMVYRNVVIFPRSDDANSKLIDMLIDGENVFLDCNLHPRRLCICCF